MTPGEHKRFMASLGEMSGQCIPVEVVVAEMDKLSNWMRFHKPHSIEWAYTKAHQSALFNLVKRYKGE